MIEDIFDVSDTREIEDKITPPKIEAQTSDYAFNLMANPNKIQPEIKVETVEESEEKEKASEDLFDKESVANLSSSSIIEKQSEEEQQHRMSEKPAYENVANDEKSIRKEKIKYICKFNRLAKRGVMLSKKFTMNDSIKDLRDENDRIKEERKQESNQRFTKETIITVVSIVEFANRFFGHMIGDLDGWSENLFNRLEDEEELFEDLCEEYEETISISPLYKLGFIIVSSGFMVHFSKKLAKEMSPILGDVVKNNPQIIPNILQSLMGGFNKQRSQPSKKMNGPSNMDDILSRIETEKKKKKTNPITEML